MVHTDGPPVQHNRADRKWMEHALALAARHVDATSPNPSVGAVILDQKGQFVAEGYHAYAGAPHAEAIALEKAGEKARGGTMYVTLEPCSHEGRTPPCAHAVVRAGLSRVVVATTDPNPLVSGKGFHVMQAAGIDVVAPFMAKEARLLNRHFMTWAHEKRPYVYLKSAQSIDGKVATRTGHSQWITSFEARNDGHRLRARVDAIVTGIGTVLADDPSLTARPEGHHVDRQPLKVVMDTHARTPGHAKLFASEQGEPRVIVAVGSNVSPEKLQTFRMPGVDVWVSPRSNTIEPKQLLGHLATLGVTSVLVEGGPTVAGSFWDAGVVDEVWVYVAPLLIGGRHAMAAVQGKGVDRLNDIPRLVDFRTTPLGPDFKLSGRIPRAHLLDDEHDE